MKKDQEAEYWPRLTNNKAAEKKQPITVDWSRYTDEDAKKVLDFLKTSVRPGTKYEVWSLVAGAGSVSEPMRIAFCRAATTRNLLIQAGIKPGDIVTQSRVVDPTSGDGNSVRIVVKN